MLANGFWFSAFGFQPLALGYGFGPTLVAMMNEFSPPVARKTGAGVANVIADDD